MTVYKEGVMHLDKAKSLLKQLKKQKELLTDRDDKLLCIANIKLLRGLIKRLGG